MGSKMLRFRDFFLIVFFINGFSDLNHIFTVYSNNYLTFIESIRFNPEPPRAYPANKSFVFCRKKYHPVIFLRFLFNYLAEAKTKFLSFDFFWFLTSVSRNIYHYTIPRHNEKQNALEVLYSFMKTTKKPHIECFLNRHRYFLVMKITLTIPEFPFLL